MKNVMFRVFSNIQHGYNIARVQFIIKSSPYSDYKGIQLTWQRNLDGDSWYAMSLDLSDFRITDTGQLTVLNKFVKQLEKSGIIDNYGRFEDQPEQTLMKLAAAGARECDYIEGQFRAKADLLPEMTLYKVVTASSDNWSNVLGTDYYDALKRAKKDHPNIDSIDVIPEKLLTLDTQLTTSL